MATAGTTIRVELLHSAIGFDQTQKDTLIGLGLRKRHKIVELKDTPQIRGMVYKVRHLVRVLDANEKVKEPVKWKGAVIVPGPKTEPKPEKKAKAGKTDKKGKKSKPAGKKPAGGGK
jgi:large subunit ribosomal protein L30